MRNNEILYRRLAALIRVNGGYLLLRGIKEDGTPLHGYHLPGTMRKEASPEKTLARYFAKYFGGDVEVKNGLEAIEKSPDELLAFYCRENQPLSFPEDAFEFGFFTPEEIDFMNVEAADRVAIKKAEVFLPYLKGKKRVTPLNAGELDKANAMVRALRYFSPRIPGEEAEQFQRLIDSEITYDGLVKAFSFVLDQFDVNYYEYLEFAAKKKKRGSE